MSNLGSDRKYLVDRFVRISSATRMDIERDAIQFTRATDTPEIVDRRIAKAIAKEEDRQIQIGVRETLERNMGFNKDKDLKRRGFRLIQGGKQDEPELIDGSAA